MLLSTDAAGTIKSRVFPGLWLDLKSLLDGNGSAVLARLQDGLKSPEHKAFVESLQPRLK